MRDASHWEAAVVREIADGAWDSIAMEIFGRGDQYSRIARQFMSNQTAVLQAGDTNGKVNAGGRQIWKSVAHIKGDLKLGILLKKQWNYGRNNLKPKSDGNRNAQEASSSHRVSSYLGTALLLVLNDRLSIWKKRLSFRS
jgi:hypothetical protein